MSIAFRINSAIVKMLL